MVVESYFSTIYNPEVPLSGFFSTPVKGVGTPLKYMVVQGPAQVHGVK